MLAPIRAARLAASGLALLCLQELLPHVRKWAPRIWSLPPAKAPRELFSITNPSTPPNPSLQRPCLQK